MELPTKIETLLGGADYVAVKGDGTTEQVKIRQLPIKLYPLYLASLGSEPRLVELFCDRPAGWSDTLGLYSLEQIVTEGERLNADFFGRWNERRLAREKLLPAADPEKTGKVLETLAKHPALMKSLLEQAGLTLPITSPSLPAKSD